MDRLPSPPADPNVIDVQAREPRVKFLTGAPKWMSGPAGIVLALVIAGCALTRLVMVVAG